MLTLRNKITNQFATVEEASKSEWFGCLSITLSEKNCDKTTRMVLLVEEKNRNFLEKLLDDGGWGSPTTLHNPENWEIVNISFTVS